MAGFEPWTYGDGFADVYDEWYAAGTGGPGSTQDCVGAVADLAHRVATGPRPVVVELGIGTGRLALPLAAAGCDVRGIDASTAMVSALRTKPGGDLPVHLGDYATVTVPTRPDERAAPPADVVLGAANALCNLLDPQDQQRCLRTAAEVLAPAGIVVLEAFVPRDPADGPDTDDHVRVRSLGVDHVVLSATVHDRAGQRLTGQLVELTTEGGVRLRPWAVRYLFPDELDAMATAAGLALVRRWADWTGRSPGPHATHQIAIYGRAAAVAALGRQ